MAAQGKFLYHLDKTTCGGRILSGASDETYTIGGICRQQARVGDPVSCGVHEGRFRICGGMGDTYSVNGALKEWAGSIESFSSCPCRARFIPSVSTHTYEYNCNAGLAAERAREAGKKAVQEVEPKQHAQTAKKRTISKIQFTVTIYAAYPGTPLNDKKTGKPQYKDGKIVVSTAGHMWIRIKKIDGDVIISDISYGFAPKKTALVGPGFVGVDDSIHYEKPYYSRVIEITNDQYNKLELFGDTARSGSSKYFDLYYNGATNSCIDFTFQSLNFAGLKPGLTWNDLSNYNQVMKKIGQFDGDLKVINNIPHVKSIPAPMPNSNLNQEFYNKKPDRTTGQWFLSRTDKEQGDSIIDKEQGDSIIDIANC